MTESTSAFYPIKLGTIICEFFIIILSKDGEKYIKQCGTFRIIFSRPEVRFSLLNDLLFRVIEQRPRGKCRNDRRRTAARRSNRSLQDLGRTRGPRGAAGVTACGKNLNDSGVWSLQKHSIVISCFPRSTRFIYLFTEHYRQRNAKNVLIKIKVDNNKKIRTKTKKKRAGQKLVPIKRPLAASSAPPLPPTKLLPAYKLFAMYIVVSIIYFFVGNAGEVHAIHFGTVQARIGRDARLHRCAAEISRDRPIAKRGNFPAKFAERAD